MTRKLLFAATAALAISSCTMQEVDDVAATPREPIRFEQFVGKATRAGDVTNESLTKFFVFGRTIPQNGEPKEIKITATKSGDTWTYSGKTMYWEEGTKYYFAATNWESTTFDEGTSPEDYAIISSSFTPRRGLDVITASPTVITGQATGNAPVSFNFKHALAKVQFTFVNEYKDYNVNLMEISLTKIWTDDNFTQKIGEALCAWGRSGSQGWWAFDRDINFTQAGTSETSPNFFIPQSLADVKLVFDLDASKSNELFNISKSYSLPLSTDEISEWQPGHVYNYKVTIKPDSSETEDPEAIEFKVNVTDWSDTTEAGSIESEVK